MRDAVAMLDTVADAAVGRIVWGERGGQDPFVVGEDAVRFEDAVNLGVDGGEGGGVQGGFDGVDGVEGVGGKGDVLGR